MQLKGTTPDFEEIKRVIEKSLRHGARAKGAVIERTALHAANFRGYIRSWKSVFQIQSYHRRGAQPQTLLVCAREFTAQEPVKQQDRFKIRSGQRIFNDCGALAQIKPLRLRFRRSQQTQ